MMNKQRFFTLSLVVLAAAASRVLPHPVNVAPIAAIALFGGAMFERKSLGFIVPALALLLSDAVIGFYAGMGTVYLAFAVVACFGLALRGYQTGVNVVVASVASSVAFFLITNCPFLVSHTPYPDGFDGLMMSYTAALPFFRNSLLGDLFYSVLLFGGFALAERRYSFLRQRVLVAV